MALCEGISISRCVNQRGLKHHPYINVPPSRLCPDRHLGRPGRGGCDKRRGQGERHEEGAGGGSRGAVGVSGFERLSILPGGPTAHLSVLGDGLVCLDVRAHRARDRAFPGGPITHLRVVRRHRAATCDAATRAARDRIGGNRIGAGVGGGGQGPAPASAGGHDRAAAVNRCARPRRALFCTSVEVFFVHAGMGKVTGRRRLGGLDAADRRCFQAGRPVSSPGACARHARAAGPSPAAPLLAPAPLAPLPPPNARPSPRRPALTAAPQPRRERTWGDTWGPKGGRGPGGGVWSRSSLEDIVFPEQVAC